MTDYRLSVAFCAVDETFSLKQAYAALEATQSAYEYLFVLSQNATPECLATVKDLCTNNNCRYIIQDGKGLGNAIRNSFQAVTGTHMILWPADDDMDPAAFPELVKLSKNNPEKIITVSRWLAKGGFDGYGKMKAALNFASQKMFSLLYKAKLTDFTNPTQIAPLEVYRKIRWQGNGFDFIPEMTFKPLKIGCGFIEVPCKTLVRREGKRHRKFIELIKYYYVICKIYRMSEKDIMVGEQQ